MINSHPDPSSGWARNLGLFGVVVSDLIGYTGAGVLAGWLAYRKWNAPWWILLMTSLLGLGLAFWRIYGRTIRSGLLNDSEEAHDDGHAP